MKEVKILLFSHRIFLSHKSFRCNRTGAVHREHDVGNWDQPIAGLQSWDKPIKSLQNELSFLFEIKTWMWLLKTCSWIYPLFLNELFLQPIIPFPASEQSWTVFLWHKKTVKQDWLSFLKCSGQAFFSLLKEVSYVIVQDFWITVSLHCELNAKKKKKIYTIESYW